MPRPPWYLDEMRACAVRVTARGWEFDRDAPCYRRLVEKYKEYRPTADDLFRVELFKAEEKAERDETTRKLWAALHRHALAASAEPDPAAETKWLLGFYQRTPCGECRMHWLEIMRESPPDLSSPGAYFAWTVAAHNHVNAKLGKPQVALEQARRLWTAAVSTPL